MNDRQNLRKSVFFLLFILVATPITLWGGQRQIVVEFRRKVTCREANKLANYRHLIFECSKLSDDKKYFWSAYYSGERPVLAVATELKQLKMVKQAFVDQSQTP